MNGPKEYLDLIIMLCTDFRGQKEEELLEQIAIYVNSVKILLKSNVIITRTLTFGGWEGKYTSYMYMKLISS